MSSIDSTDKKNPIFLKDYEASAFLLDTVDLDVSIEEEGTVVLATLSGRRNAALKKRQSLILDGEDLETLLVSLDGKELSANEYRIEEKRLVIDSVDDDFVLTTKVRILPDKNTHLSGFYRSQNGYFTQCEPQGFRRITWFVDRPDVMARYTVTLHADKQKFPVLLANGNKIACGDEAHERHFTRWEDPFKKPSYLFAMVAGTLDVLKESYRTLSGREVALEIYVEPGKLNQCAHAMEALKKSMRWDEENFGLECDLDRYMIVAVSDFNFGAMENKGLNIFNAKYVLARADVATDQDFKNIDCIVAHEYFHNWTGNRITCRDWFQLSLKEGLTVFRDQEFSADVHNVAVTRICDVKRLRMMQFPEDAGPMAHPVRPLSCLEINNFYTTTVYEKGAEVVRMLHTLIGKRNFMLGMKIYFQRHDGEAVTCDDFVAAMETAYNKDTDTKVKIDFNQFMNWYAKAGTPSIKAEGFYDSKRRQYTLTVTQHCPPTRGQSDKKPFLIPVAIALFDAKGQAIDINCKNEENKKEKLLMLSEEKQSFTFENISEHPVPSLLRNFSAPVILDYGYSDAELIHLLTFDTDPFNRWEAGQRLFSRLILKKTKHFPQENTAQWPNTIVEVMQNLLLSGDDPAFIAKVLTLPDEATLAEQMEVVDPEALYLARTQVAVFLATGLERVLAHLYAVLTPSERYGFNKGEVARRSLRNLCLAYLNELDCKKYRQLAFTQFAEADNMTDKFAALTVLVNSPGDEGAMALALFYETWKEEALVVDKWLAVQAAGRLDGTQKQVQMLTDHPAFDLYNPNKVYALLRTFGANHRHFHAKDGSGYAFIAEEIVQIDQFNPQVASRLARSFDRWKKFDETRKEHARAALQKIKAVPELSNNVFEIVAKILKGSQS